MQYFVSYSHAGPRAAGFGYQVYDTSGPMTADTLEFIREDIAKKYSASQIVILNFQPLA